MSVRREIRGTAAGFVALAVLGCASAIPAKAVAQEHQHQHEASPYAGQETREIKALAPERVAGLLAGEGVGYAKAAELNGVPGPRHVLDLMDELELTPSQREATEASYRSMRDAAIPLGERLVELERELDRAFAERTLDAASLAERTRTIGEVEGELRAVHLRAHLEMLDILTMHQVHQYATLRGYDIAGHAYEPGG